MLTTNSVKMAVHLSLFRKPTNLHMAALQSCNSPGILTCAAPHPTKLVIKLFSKLGCVCSKVRDFKDVVGVPSEQTLYQSKCRLPGAACLSR